MFFYKKRILIIATVCAFKLNKARYEEGIIIQIFKLCIEIISYMLHLLFKYEIKRLKNKPCCIQNFIIHIKTFYLRLFFRMKKCFETCKLALNIFSKLSKYRLKYQRYNELNSKIIECRQIVDLMVFYCISFRTKHCWN